MRTAPGKVIPGLFYDMPFRAYYPKRITFAERADAMKNALYLYNTLTRKKELFEPLAPPFAGMYVCGPTVYSESHLGHARPAVTFDVLYRYLLHLGYKVDAEEVRVPLPPGLDVQRGAIEHLGSRLDGGPDAIGGRQEARSGRPCALRQRVVDVEMA